MRNPPVAGPTYLVSTADEVHVVFVEELCDHVGSEGEGHTAVVLPPAQHVLVGVGPEQVTQQALVRHVGGPHHAPHLLHGLEVWRQAFGRMGDRSGTTIWHNLVATATLGSYLVRFASYSQTWT